MITENTNLLELYNLSLASLSDVDSGENFMVRDLFRGFEWNRIPKGFRTKLGIMFFAYATEKGAKKIEALGKTAQNQQLYRKR